MKPIIIIPAYKPEPILLSLTHELGKIGFSIIIVNDGSGTSYLNLFQSLSALPFVTVLHHAVNVGKGQALKTAFNYFLTTYPSDCPGVITADADGQHLVEDIQRVTNQLIDHPHAISLGVRSFDKGVPFRSRFGNTLTRLIFRLFIGKSLKDTQTGLRAIPRDFLKYLLKTPTQGYDFELDMLISASKNKISILEVPIHTVYIDANKSSHFNPLVDSFKIYFVFFRYLFFSIISGLIDFFAFSFAFMLCQQILLSETLARLFSGTCNFFLNKELVFKSKQNFLPEAIKYALLCGVNLVFSYALISSLVYFGANVFFSKILSLAGLFIANFAIQKLLVFGRSEEVKALDSTSI
jgi:putative flippase GtrA